MLKTIFALTLILAISLQTFNGQECQKNMFFVNSVNVNTSNLMLTFSFRLRLDETIVNGSSNFTLQDYVRACLNQMIFKVKPINISVWTRETYMFKDTDNLDNIIVIQLNYIQLYFFSTYDIQIAYDLKNDSTETISYSTRSLTCFGSPGQLTGTGTSYFSDGSFQVMWFGLTAVNAPFLCYYRVGIIWRNETMTELHMNENYLIFSKNEVEQLRRVQVMPTNEFTCYEANYTQWRSECSGLLLYGRVWSVNMADTTTNTNRFTSTTKSTNGASVNKSYCTIMIGTLLYYISKLIKY